MEITRPCGCGITSGQGTPPVFTGGVPVFFKEEDAAGFAHIAGLERTAEHMIE